MCYHQNLTRSEVGRDQDGLDDIHIEEICESALFTKFGRKKDAIVSLRRPAFDLMFLVTKRS